MYRQANGHPPWMIIMWLRNSNSSPLRLWPVSLLAVTCRDVCGEVLFARGQRQLLLRRQIKVSTHSNSFPAQLKSPLFFPKQHERWACNSDVSVVKFSRPSSGFSRIAIWIAQRRKIAHCHHSVNVWGYVCLGLLGSGLMSVLRPWVCFPTSHLEKKKAVGLAVDLLQLSGCPATWERPGPERLLSFVKISWPISCQSSPSLGFFGTVIPLCRVTAQLPKLSPYASPVCLHEPCL